MGNLSCGTHASCMINEQCESLMLEITIESDLSRLHETNPRKQRDWLNSAQLQFGWINFFFCQCDRFFISLGFYSCLQFSCDILTLLPLCRLSNEGRGSNFDMFVCLPSSFICENVSSIGRWGVRRNDDDAASSSLGSRAMKLMRESEILKSLCVDWDRTSFSGCAGLCWVV